MEILSDILELLSSIFINGADLTGNLSDYVISEYAVATPMLEQIKPIAESFIPIGICMVALRWSGALLQDVLRKDFDVNVIIKSLLRLIVGVIIVSNSVSLIFGIEKFVGALLVDCQAVLGSPTNNMNSVVSFFEDMLTNFSTNTGVSGTTVNESIPFIYYLYYIIIFLVTNNISGILSFFISIAAYTRALRLMYKFMYAPLGISDIYQGGIRSGGMMYFRSVLSIMMEPIITYFIIVFGLILLDNPLTIGTHAFGAFVTFFWGFFIYLAIIVMINKSKEIAQMMFT